MITNHFVIIVVFSQSLAAQLVAFFLLLFNLTIKQDLDTREI